MRVAGKEIRKQLEAVRRRREEAARVETALARNAAALLARLAELEGEAPGRPPVWREAMRPGLWRIHGSTPSAEDVAKLIKAWRRRVAPVSPLWMDVQSDRDHLRGDPAAPLIVVEYGDYQCPECAEAHGLRARVGRWLEDGRLCIAYRHFPLLEAHPLALRGAQAAEAAAAQGRFWDMHDRLMEPVSAHGGQVQAKPARRMVEPEHAASRLGMDVERFQADLDEPAALHHILEDYWGGLASGVTGTPTFYVNAERACGVGELCAQIARCTTPGVHKG
jgi:hypothetical protein